MAFIHTGRLWPYKTIPYLLTNFVKAPAAKKYHDAILAAMREWEMLTSLRFMPFGEYFPKYVLKHGRKTPHVLTFRVGVDPWRVIKTGDMWAYRAHSGVGITKRGPTIVASAQASQQTVLHEIGHALGLGHEQCRPDRDKHVIVVQPAMSAKEYNTNYAIRGPLWLMHGPYDMQSLLHYRRVWPVFFAKTSATRALGPVQRTVKIGRRNRRTWISQGDAAAIETFYKKKHHI